MQNIISLLESDSRFTILLSALTAAGMVDTLGGSGPFTLFAPTDNAFSQLLNAARTQLLKREAKATLTNLMTFHAVAGKELQVDLFARQSIPTIYGQPLHIKKLDGQISVDGASIIDTIDAANGIIFVINAVLVPASVDINLVKPQSLPN